MAKKKKKKQKPHHRPPLPSMRRLAAEIILEDIHDAIEAGKWDEAQLLLEEALEEFPRHAEMHYLLGTCFLEQQQPRYAVRSLERAVALSGALPEAYYNLGSAYMSLGAIMAARWALRQARQQQMLMDREMLKIAERLDRETDKLIAEFAAQFGADRETTERVLIAHDRGRTAVEGGDLEEGVSFIQEAIRLAPRFVSPHNNVALAHFARGEHDQAIACLRHVLDDLDPQNLHALGSMVRVLATKGDREEAMRYAERLAALPLKDPVMTLKVAEAFASLGDDQKVHDLLSRHRGWLMPSDEALWQYLLGTAAANLGKPQEALRAYRAALKAGKRDGTLLRRIGQIEQALAEGSALPRWLYFEEVAERDVREQLEGLIKTISGKKLSEEQLAAEVQRYVTQHPQVVEAVIAMLYNEEGETAAQAVGVLQMMGTEEAVNALKSFAFGKAGKEDARFAALFALVDLEQVSTEKPVRIWTKGKWEELLPRRVLIADRESPYPPQVAKQIETATLAQQRGDVAQARRIWQQLIAEHPNVREAYNNMAALLLTEGKMAEGEAMLKKAVEVDPNYVFPRVNLASIAIHRGDLQAAEEWLKPIGIMETMHPDELGAYFRVSGMLHVQKDDRKAAEKDLENALNINPHDQIAKDLLVQLRGGLFGRLRRWWK